MFKFWWCLNHHGSGMFKATPNGWLCYKCNQIMIKLDDCG